MTPKQLQKKLRNTAQRVRVEEAKALRQTAEFALGQARKLSSGTFQAKGEYARRNGKPFRRRGGRVRPRDPAIINERTGEFKALWRIRAISHSLSDRKPNAWELVNDSDHAQYMNEHGTVSMIPRPIINRIRERAKPKLEKEIREALRRALR